MHCHKHGSYFSWSLEETLQWFHLLPRLTCLSSEMNGGKLSQTFTWIYYYPQMEHWRKKFDSMNLWSFLALNLCGFLLLSTFSALFFSIVISAANPCEFPVRFWLASCHKQVLSKTALNWWWPWADYSGTWETYKQLYQSAANAPGWQGQTESSSYSRLTQSSL